MSPVTSRWRDELTTDLGGAPSGVVERVSLLQQRVLHGKDNPAPTGCSSTAPAHPRGAMVLHTLLQTVVAGNTLSLSVEPDVVPRPPRAGAFPCSAPRGPAARQGSKPAGNLFRKTKQSLFHGLIFRAL